MTSSFTIINFKEELKINLNSKLIGQKNFSNVEEMFEEFQKNSRESPPVNSTEIVDSLSVFEQQIFFKNNTLKNVQ